MRRYTEFLGKAVLLEQTPLMVVVTKYEVCMDVTASDHDSHAYHRLQRLPLED
jgi:hypothetical protein